MNAPREEVNSTCRNRGRSVSLIGAGGKTTKSVTINEEESDEEQSNDKTRKPTVGILKHKSN
jgi:hypothetical protein